MQQNLWNKNNKSILISPKYYSLCPKFPIDNSGGALTPPVTSSKKIQKIDNDS
jgi:hypothetical protein